jgi:hypothetical protein
MSSSNLKPLLLPQLVEERKKLEVHHHTCSEEELAYAYHTTNSSSSDIATPLTPTFSSRGHYRTSSSTSSIDLAYLQCLESPASPVPSQAPKQTGARPLPDVKEEPFEREDVLGDFNDSFGLYSCLCKKYHILVPAQVRLTVCKQATNHANIAAALNTTFLATLSLTTSSITTGIVSVTVLYQ